MTLISRPCLTCKKLHEVEYESNPKTNVTRMKRAEKKLEQKVEECKHE